MSARYWEDFYASRRSRAVPDEPSAFARWVGLRETSAALLVDIGTGTARDALWFARNGHAVLGVDYAAPAVEQAQRNASEQQLPATFELLDLYQPQQVTALADRLARGQRSPLLYGRFLVHALADEGRHALWQLAATSLGRGGLLYLEFRTGKDAGARHEFGEHFRKFLDSDLVVDELEERGGRIAHRDEGHGRAVYRHEDPHVCRLVSVWQR